MATTKQCRSKMKMVKVLDFTGAISKWGNSYAIHIPAEIMKSYGLKEGDRVRIPRIHRDMDLERIEVCSRVQR